MPGDLSRIRMRPATREDIPALVIIWNTSFAEDQDAEFGTARSESIFSDSRWLSAVWEEPNRVRGEEVFVGVVDERVVGLVTIGDRGQDLELINLDVPMQLQGRGIGTAIVQLVESLARKKGKTAVTLGTSRNADGVAWKSLPWWQHLGYRITHEEENEWTQKIGPGAREIRMRKDLL